MSKQVLPLVRTSTLKLSRLVVRLNGSLELKKPMRNQSQSMQGLTGRNRLLTQELFGHYADLVMRNSANHSDSIRCIHFEWLRVMISTNSQPQRIFHSVSQHLKIRPETYIKYRLDPPTNSLKASIASFFYKGSATLFAVSAKYRRRRISTDAAPFSS